MRWGLDLLEEGICKCRQEVRWKKQGEVGKRVQTFICKINTDSLKDSYYCILFIVVKLIFQISYASSCYNVLFFYLSHFLPEAIAII